MKPSASGAISAHSCVPWTGASRWKRSVAGRRTLGTTGSPKGAIGCRGVWRTGDYGASSVQSNSLPLVMHTSPVGHTDPAHVQVMGPEPHAAGRAAHEYEGII